jgi:hypothetical protein
MVWDVFFIALLPNLQSSVVEKLVYDSGGTSRSPIADNMCGSTTGVHKVYTNLGATPKF